MCRDPNLSSRRRRRLDQKKSKPKRYRPWGRHFFVKGKTDIRQQTRGKVEPVDLLIEQSAEPSHEPEPFSTENNLVRAAVESRRQQDARDAQEFAAAYPYADLNAA